MLEDRKCQNCPDKKWCMNKIHRFKPCHKEDTNKKDLIFSAIAFLLILLIMLFVTYVNINNEMELGDPLKIVKVFEKCAYFLLQFFNL